MVWFYKGRVNNHAYYMEPKVKKIGSQWFIHGKDIQLIMIFVISTTFLEEIVRSVSFKKNKVIGLYSEISKFEDEISSKQIFISPGSGISFEDTFSDYGTT